MRKTNKLILLVLFLAVFLCNCPVFAQSLTDKQITAIERDITAAMKDWHVNGMSVAIIKDGKVVYLKGFGYRDLERKLPVTPETQFAIGSCSKAFTSFIAGLLVDEKKLAWDTPIISYLPDFRMHDPVATQLTTTRDLLTHRTGLPRGTGELAFLGYTGYRRNEIYKNLKYFQPNKTFRQIYQYSNVGYVTAGYLEEQISGKTWEELVAERIFKPLGMTSSNFSVETMKKTPNHSLPFISEKGKIREIDFTNLDNIAPAGAINSNVIDMAKWLMLHMNNGKLGDKQLISKESLKQIHSPQVVMPISEKDVFALFDSISYGMAWVINDYRKHNVIWHTGGIFGFTAYTGFMPKEKIGVIILLNDSSAPLTTFLPLMLYDHMLGLEPIDWNKRFLKIVQEYLEKLKPTASKRPEIKPSHPLQDYVGEFTNPAYKIITIKLENGNLIGKFSRYDFKLKHLAYDIFRAEELKPSKNVNLMTMFGVVVQFHTDINGKITSLSMPQDKNLETIIVFKKINK